MRTLHYQGLLVGLLVLCACRSFAKSPEDIFRQNQMALVHVEMAADSTNPNSRPSAGTGFIIGGDGFVLTAKHVISGYINSSSTPISVRIGSLDGRRVAADPYPLDIGVDVAMLKLRSPISLGITSYTTVQRGDSEKYANRPGAPIAIMGFNLTSNLSITEGTLSSTLGGGTNGNLTWDIAASGAVYGMSGAPVFDTDDGDVIGILIGGQANTTILYAYPEQFLVNLASIAHWTQPQSQTQLDTATGSNALTYPQALSLIIGGWYCYGGNGNRHYFYVGNSGGRYFFRMYGSGSFNDGSTYFVEQAQISDSEWSMVDGGILKIILRGGSMSYISSNTADPNAWRRWTLDSFELFFNGQVLTGYVNGKACQWVRYDVTKSGPRIQ